MIVRIKNWEKFQHFKDRTPPWIKLYRDLLNDPDWHELDGESAKVLMMLWLIASEDHSHQGTLPDAKKLAFRLRITETKLNQLLTKLSHWLEHDDISVISERYQVDTPETETERETEKIFRAQDALSELGVDPQVSADWIAHRNTLKAKVTQTVINSIAKQADKAGITLQAALEMSCQRGWRGFEADWVKSPAKQSAQEAWRAAMC